VAGPPHIGVTLPTSGEPHVLDVARSAEKAGLDGVWSPDHLLWGPFLDSPSLLSAAAAVTERIAIGWSVMLPALRPAGWAAKQVATVQQISRGRLQLGVGLGWAGPEWKAAGTSASGRAARTDAFLRALPDLLAGKPADPTPGGGSTMTLEPAVPIPPLWIGGNSDAALHPRKAT
jgi:alkanesulfonate monooxygenase SsuD/methylene tetrahydromethanopterin reductase-like flavin-dependent oxidoreductase (luciferase family)